MSTKEKRKKKKKKKKKKKREKEKERKILRAVASCVYSCHLLPQQLVHTTHQTEFERMVKVTVHLSLVINRKGREKEKKKKRCKWDEGRGV